MGEVSHQDLTLNWVASTDESSRLDFIKQCLDCCKLPEAGRLLNFVTNLKKRRKREFDARERQQRAEVAPASTPVPPASTSVPPPSSTDSSAGKTARRAWWMAFKKKDIVAIDCEMVSLEAKNEDGKHIVQAATVSIANFADDSVRSFTVRHELGSFKVNSYTRKVNGFERWSLKNGRALEEVRTEVENILKDKLVVTCNGVKDFQSLGLQINDFEFFEFHQFWQKGAKNEKKEQVYSKLGEKIYQPIGIRNLYKAYFGVDIQAGVHSAATDAKATIRLFREVYCPFMLEQGEEHNRLYTNYDEFDDLDWT